MQLRRRHAAGLLLLLAALWTLGHLLSPVPGEAINSRVESETRANQDVEKVRRGVNVETADGTRQVDVAPDSEPVPVDPPVLTGETGSDEPTQVSLLEISGRVQDSDGNPVPGMVVYGEKLGRLSNAGSDPDYIETSSFAITAASGAYRLANLHKGDYRIYTLADDTYTAAHRIVPAGYRAADLTLVTGRRLSLQGRVTNEYLEPLPDVRIVTRKHGRAAATTDRLGQYSLTTVAANNPEYATSLCFSLAGYRSHCETLDPGNGSSRQTVDVVLRQHRQTALVRGTVLQADGTPATGVVDLRAPRQELSYHANLGANGSFAITVAVGRHNYRLRISPEGSYQEYSNPALEVGSEGVDLGTLMLPPLGTGRLSGRIVNVEGEGITGVRLALHSELAAAKSMLLDTDQSGRFDLAAVPEGPLFFETLSLPLLNIEGIHLLAGTAQNVELVVDWGRYKLAGTVLDQDGRPAANARVILRWNQGQAGIVSRSMRMTRTDVSGRFRFQQLGAGKHSISAIGSDNRAAETEVTIGADVVAPVLRLGNRI